MHGLRYSGLWAPGEDVETIFVHPPLRWSSKYFYGFILSLYVHLTNMSFTPLTRPTQGLARIARGSTLRRILSRPLSTSSSSLQDETSSVPPSELEQAKARAWYLPTTADPATETRDAPSTTRIRRTTTFDPSSTTPDAAALAIPPLPADCPAGLESLHHFLTCEAESIDPSSVIITSTRPLSGSGGSATRGLGDGVDEVISPPGGSSRPTWDWMVVATVRGRGRGIVPRAEREVRVWVSILHSNVFQGTIR